MDVALLRRLAGRVLPAVLAALLIIVGCTVDFTGPGGGDGGDLGPPTDTDDVDLPAEATQSFFTAFQIDPVEEDTAGPKFVVAADVDKDGLTDLVSAWNQSQPVQLHLQRRDASGVISFRTVTLGGTSPIAVVAGVEVGQIDDDNGDGTIDDNDWLDVVVLSKASGFRADCPQGCPFGNSQQVSRLEGEIIVLFNPGAPEFIPDGDTWNEMILVNPFVADRWIHDQFPGNETVDFNESKTKPEWSGFTSLVVANIDGVSGDDILVVLNPAQCDSLGQDPPTNTVDLWPNPGSGLARLSEEWGVPVDGLSRGAPVTLTTEAPQAKDLLVMDIDEDGDLDVILTATNAISQNIRWLRNPLVAHQPGGPDGPAEVLAGNRIGLVRNEDYCEGGDESVEDQLCPDGQIDCEVADGMCTGGVCVGGPEDGADCQNNGDCEGDDGCCTPDGWWYRALGWEERPVGQIDTGAGVMALGDVDDDGSDDILIRSATGKIVQWFRRPNELAIQPEFPPDDPVPDRFNFPWQVYTLTEFEELEPEAIAVGDITGDGHNEILVAAGGGVFWYDETEGETVFDPWSPNPIIQDGPVPTADDAAPGTGVGVGTVETSTHINTLLIVDVDGDGKNDVVGTLDRRSRSGLSDDRLVWYRNTRPD